MRHRSRYQKQQENKLRIEMITKLFSSAAITIGIVFVVGVAVPKSPTASLEDIVVYADRLSYRVNIVDPDSAIQNDSLRVRLSNQLEEYVTTLSFGYTLGSFDSLKPNTSYFLEVLANKGFGEERLTSERIKTYARDGGLILDTRLVSEPLQYDQTLEVDVATYNEQYTYQSFALQYARIYEQYEEDTSLSSSEEIIEYSTLSLSSPFETLSIEGIYSGVEHVALRLIGFTSSGNDLVVIDEATYIPPFSINAAVYWRQVSVHHVSLYFYPDSRIMGQATYVATLYRGMQKIASKPIEVPAYVDFESEEQIIVTFASLVPATSYRLETTATYIDPLTLRETTASLETLETTTLGSYQFEITIEENETEFIVIVTLLDPSHNFQQLFSNVYDPAYYYPIDSDATVFNNPDDKTGTLYITKPDLTVYRIEIGVRNQDYYSHYDVIHTINA